MALRPGRVVLSALAPEKQPKPPRVRDRSRELAEHRSTAKVPNNQATRGASNPRPEKPKKPRPEPETLAESLWLFRKAWRSILKPALTPGQIAANRRRKGLKPITPSTQEARP